MKLYSPATVKYLADKYGFHFQKNLGQNFLVDGNIVNKIVDSAAISSDDLVLEIGAGIGTLTKALSERAKMVIVIEIDKNLLPILDETLGGCENIKIHIGNALKTNFDELVSNLTQGEFGPGAKPYKIVANLPYYITSPLIMHSLENHFSISEIVIMVQKEVADRITASPGNKDYGAITVSINYYSEPEIVLRVPKKVFIPQPEVESSVVKLAVRQAPPVSVKNEKLFFQVVKASFGQRRKTLANTLAGIVDRKETIKNILENLEIDSGRRGETLSLKEFAKIANSIDEIKSNARQG